MHKNKPPYGFMLVGVVIAIAVIALISLAGWFVWHNSKSNQQLQAKPTKKSTATSAAPQVKPSNTANFSSISTPDGKVSISLPSSWQVLADPNNQDAKQIISVNKGTQVCKGGVCGVAGCIDVDDPVACKYQAELQPKVLANNTNQVWNLTVERTDWSIDKARESLLGDINAQDALEQSSNPINGYDAFYVKVNSSGYSVGDYVDIHYFIESNGYLVHLSNREQYSNDSSSPTHWDSSKYSSEFANIAKSIELKP